MQHLHQYNKFMTAKTRSNRINRTNLYKNQVKFEKLILKNAFLKKIGLKFEILDSKTLNLVFLPLNKVVSQHPKFRV
jgi:hypothetical protein